MKIVFIGVVRVGYCCLRALLDLRANVVGVVTVDKDNITRESGMDESHYADLTEVANEHGIPCFVLQSIKDKVDTRLIKDLHPDIIYCIGWPKIIPNDILTIPPKGCIGIHPSLLPQRRGGAPTNWAIIDGLTESGVTLFYLTKGIDNGDIIAQQPFRIDLSDDVQRVRRKITFLATSIVKSTYENIRTGTAERTPQDESQASYTKRRRPEDGLIDWSQSPLQIYNFIRALSKPYPGAFTHISGEKYIVWEARLEEQKGEQKLVITNKEKAQ